MIGTGFQIHTSSNFLLKLLKLLPI